MKTVNDFYENLTGDWQGSYSLWLRPGSAAEKSDITAQFRSAAKGAYFLMTYSWMRQDEGHEGVFLFGGKGKTANATWGDTFHSAPEPMPCSGGLQDSGKKLVVTGTYSAGEGPEWGWRTAFIIQAPDELVMEAYNITPDGDEGLAVKAVLKRVVEK